MKRSAFGLSGRMSCEASSFGVGRMLGNGSLEVVEAMMGRIWSKVDRSSCSLERAEEMRLESWILMVRLAWDRRRGGLRSSMARDAVIGSSSLIATRNMLR